MFHAVMRPSLFCENVLRENLSKFNDIKVFRYVVHFLRILKGKFLLLMM